MMVYYGLTLEESKREYLMYENNENFTYKGVNTSLEGLRKFVKDNNLESIIEYYTILDINKFNIASNVMEDKEYDMIAVLIPFKFKIENIHKLF